MSKQEYIILKSGEKMPLTKLREMIPDCIYFTHTHIDVCETMAQATNLNLPPEIHEIYVNILVRQSKHARTITELITLSNAKKIEIKEIVSSFIDNNFKHFFSDQNISFPCPQKLTNYLDWRYKIRFILKILINQLYRIFRKKLKAQPYTIRTWVEISEQIFQEAYPKSNILIYPFTLNIKRHLNYIKHTFRNHQTASLMGVPYPLSSIIKLIFMPSKTDKIITNTEYQAYQKHGKELATITEKTLLTTDEFEAASKAMCKTLQQQNRTVFNIAHGISFDCPYIGYDKFQVYNQAQKDYYTYKSPQVEYITKIKRNTSDTDKTTPPKQFNPVIIMIHSNFKNCHMIYETQLQEKVIQKLKDIKQKSNIPIYIKTHPNIKEKELASLKNSHNTIKYLNELEPCHPIFINISSVAYYDFITEGPFIFIDEGIVPITTIFSKDIICANIPTLPKTLQSYFNYPQWQSHLQNQLNQTSSYQ